MTDKTDLLKMTLEELKALRGQWLFEASGRGDIDACLMVGRELGEPGKAYPYSARIPPICWRSGKITTHHSIIRTVFPPHLQRAVHGPWDHIIVTIGGTPGNELLGGAQVCSYLWGEADDHGEYSQRNLFVPGDWMEKIKAALPKAEKTIRNRGIAAEEKERRELLDLLTPIQEKS